MANPPTSLYAICHTVNPLRKTHPHLHASALSSITRAYDVYGPEEALRMAKNIRAEYDDYRLEKAIKGKK